MKQIDRQNRTKKNISLALYALLLKNPYEQISVEDICSKAGISRVTFYHYYDKKDDVFIQFSDERFAEFFDEFTKMGAMSFEVLILEMFRFLKRNSRQLAILRYAKKEEILMEQFYSYCRYLFSNNLTGDILGGKENPSKIPFLVGGLFQVIMRWLDEGMVTPPEMLAQNVINVIVKP